MKHDHINYLVVGLFVLGLGVAFLAVMYRLTGSSGEVEHYRVYYQNVAGLKFGTPVYYEGFQIGQVDDVSPVTDQGKVRYQVSTSVIAGWKIPADSVALIISTGLLSARSIDIRAGDSGEFLKPGDEIQGKPAINIMSTINAAAEDFHHLAATVKPLINTLQVGITDTLRDVTDLLQSLDGLASEDLKLLLNKAASRVDSPQLFEQLSSLLQGLNQGADNLNLLLGTENRSHVSEILGNLDVLLLEMNETRREMNGVLENLDSVVTEMGGLATDNRQDLQASVRRLRESMEVIASHVEAVSHHMEGSSRNLNEFSRQIRENPSLLLRGSAQPESGVKE